MKPRFHSDDYVDQAEQALRSIEETPDPQTANALMQLATIRAQLAITRAIQELGDSLVSSISYLTTGR